MKELKPKESESRGWRGDSEGHARAGRLGGLKAAQVKKAKKERERRR